MKRFFTLLLFVLPAMGLFANNGNAAAGSEAQSAQVETSLQSLTEYAAITAATPLGFGSQEAGLFDGGGKAKGKKLRFKNRKGKMGKKKSLEFNQAKGTKSTQKTAGDNQIVAILLCFFFGLLGIHRFYYGYVGIGLLELFTAGVFGILTFIDFIRLIIGDLGPR